MRSDLVFEAMEHVSDRFLLTKLVSKTTRKFHRPNTRVEDTTNAVLARFTHAYPIAAVQCIRTTDDCSVVAQAETLTSCKRPMRSSVR